MAHAFIAANGSIQVPGPDEFIEVRSEAGVAFTRPETAGWVRTALSRGRTLQDAAAGDPGHRTMKGRGTVYLVEAGAVRCVVRRYLRGGGMRFLGDRYLRIGKPRPEREAIASREAIRRGIATPRVLAWAVYPAGPFYRADLVTEFLPASNTLAELLFERTTPAEERRELLESTGGMVARMAAAGVRHADLNANNILLQRLDTGYEPAALDLDRMVVNRDGGAIDPGAMLARLERSLRKLGTGRTGELSAAEWRSLRAGAGRSPGEAA